MTRDWKTSDHPSEADAGTPLATVAQLEAIYRPLTDTERPVVTALLARASRILRARMPDVDARIAAGTLDAELVADVVSAAVLRTVRGRGIDDPDRPALRAETVGPFRRDFDTSVATASVELAFTAGELALLAPPSTGRSRASTITVRAGLPGSPYAPPWGGRVRRR